MAYKPKLLAPSEGGTGAANTATLGSFLIGNGTNFVTSSSASGIVSWTVITIDQSVAVGNGYICNKAGLLILTLPASASIGDTFIVTGMNTALGWKIAQNANQQIFIGTSSTTVGVGGSLASTNIRDTVTAVCTVAGASTVWTIISSIGNITVV